MMDEREKYQAYFAKLVTDITAGLKYDESFMLLVDDERLDGTHCAVAIDSKKDRVRILIRLLNNAIKHVAGHMHISPRDLLIMELKALDENPSANRESEIQEVQFDD